MLPFKACQQAIKGEAGLLIRGSERHRQRVANAHTAALLNVGRPESALVALECGFRHGASPATRSRQRQRLRKEPSAKARRCRQARFGRWQRPWAKCRTLRALGKQQRQYAAKGAANVLRFLRQIAASIFDVQACGFQPCACFVFVAAS